MFFEGKKVIVLNLKRAWDNKTESERNKILNLYGINISELEIMKSKKIIVLSETFVPELPIEENQKYMVRLINKYPHDDIVIKIHPRDEIDYEKLFPSIMVCKLRVPAQLFDLIGVHFKIAATFNSSAVYDFSYNIRIDWYGEEVKDYYPNHPIPQNAHLCKL